MKLNLNKLRNTAIDATVTVLKKARHIPDQHKAALDAIMEDDALTDSAKLLAMSDYFAAAVQKMADDNA